MPELPEVETVRMALDDALLGGRICAVAQSAKPMRWAIPKNLKTRILGGRIEAVRRRAKYLLLDIGTERGAANHANQANHANHAKKFNFVVAFGDVGVGADLPAIGAQT